jgi:ABC-type sugar transport system substrate-binding protein
MRKRRKLSSLILCIVIIVSMLLGTMLLTSCETGGTGERIKIAYICKQLSNTWFQQVTKGISNTCKKYGIEYLEYDANFDDAKCLEYVDEAIDAGADGILITTTKQEFGPVIAQKCSDAGVLLMTIDDTMLDGNGVQLPHIGMATSELSTMGGTALAKLAKEKGFFNDGNRVAVIQINITNLSVFKERIVGYREALIAQTPLREDNFIIIYSPTGMVVENLPVTREKLLNYSNITHWIITGGNDESAIAPLFVLREKGVPEENIIACGLGLSSRVEVEQEFKNGNENYISIAAQPQLEGQKGVEMIYDNLVNGTKIKSMTVIGGQIITSDNYRIFFEN